METPPALLLVDDRQENLLTLEAVLQPLGYRLVSVRSGEEALGRLLGDAFALVVMDVRMPGLDGFQTARLLRQHPRTRTVPILFLSASEPNGPGRRLESVGPPVDWLQKPASAEEICARVEALLAQAADADSGQQTG